MMEQSELIQAALCEDLGSGDVTTDAVIPADLQVSAVIAGKATGVIAGMGFAQATFHAVDATLAWEPKVACGAVVQPGTIVAEIRGVARSILKAERVALNFLQRLSGIATQTRQYVDSVAGTQVKILDTRKTAPGWRVLEKAAVRCGGGVNHRQGLYDAYLIKSNHADLVGGLREAMARVQASRDAALLFEVEVRDLDELRLAIEAGVDRCLLDNFSPALVREAVTLTAGKIALEVSGGVTLDNVAEYAATGVDFISIGALTHSAQALDLHLRFDVTGQRHCERPAALRSLQAP